MPSPADTHAFWTIALRLWRGLRVVVLAVSGWIVVLQAWNAIDPPKPLRISSETTLITEPIGTDGRPEFGKAILRQIKPAASPDTNGAIPFWQAAGTGLFEQRHADLLFNEIGAVRPDDQSVLTRFPRIESLFDSESLEEAAIAPSDDGKNLSLRKQVLLRMAAQRPWPSDVPEAIPRWIRKNHEPLDLLVEASKRPDFYSPSPSLLEDRPSELIAFLLPTEQAIGVAIPSLLARATFRLSN